MSPDPQPPEVRVDPFGDGLTYIGQGSTAVVVTPAQAADLARALAPDQPAGPASAAAGVLAAIESWAMGPCPSFTCTEAEQLAEFATACDAADLAEGLLSSHADSDEPGDLHYPQPETGDDS